MTPQSAKAKGRRLQKYVVAKILEAFPSLTARDCSSRSMGAQGTDVILSEQAHILFPFAIECKAQEINKSLLNMWDQTKSNIKDNDIPLLVLGANNYAPLAILDLNTFIELMSAT